MQLMELPCPQCGAMLPAPQLQAHIKAEHADAAASGSGGGDAAAAAPRPGPPKPPPGKAGGPSRKHLAAFASLKAAVQEANATVKAARKANMPDASRLPPSQRQGKQ